MVESSFDARFVATKSESCPKCVWVWDTKDMSLNSLLVQESEIADMAWSPASHNLNISTKQNRLFLWSPKGASVCQVPAATSQLVSTVPKSKKEKSEKI